MILLDTCTILWDALAPSQLSENAAEAINDADSEGSLLISDISLWEIAMLMKKGRIELNTSPTNFLNLFLQSRNVEVRAIDPGIADLAVNFGQEINNDPADRIIAATSITARATLVTGDRNFLACSLLDTLW